MDPESKRRISRSLGSLDDILVTLERLKQGPGFSRATEEIKVTNGKPGGGRERGGDDEQAGAQESRSNEKDLGYAGERGSKGNVFQVLEGPSLPSLISWKHKLPPS